MNEQFEKMLANKTYLMLGFVAFGGGVGLGYFLGKRDKKPTYHVIPAQKEFDHEAMESFLKKKESYQQIEIDIQPSETEEFIQQKLKERLQLPDEYNGAPIIVESELEPRSIFAHNDDDWDYESELKTRTPATPYIIHKDEFFANELDYTQVTLTYYEGDNILCDEDDTPVYNHDVVVGPMLFGHGSGDPKIVHIRNDKRRAEYEILHDPGMYSVEILGVEIENNDRAKDLKHSRVPKFRDD